MINKDKLLKIISKKKYSKNKIRCLYEKEYSTKIHPYLLTNLLENLERDGLIKSKKDGWITYYWRE